MPTEMIGETLYIEPAGDILFAMGLIPGQTEVAELVAIEPGDRPGTGALAPQFRGMTTDQVPTKLRIRLTAKTAVVLLEQITGLLVHLHGMPPGGVGEDSLTVGELRMPEQLG
jgi:hypothetical protein